jgi:predicted exporter
VLRHAPLVLGVMAAGVLVANGGGIWNHRLGALSPVSQAAQDLDTELRAGLGAPDVRDLVVARARRADAALALAERLAGPLDALQAGGAIAGYDSPARLLPSRATQDARRASLPDAATLHARLLAATAALPLKADKLAPFEADVATARAAPPIDRASMQGGSLGLAVDAMLVRQGDYWRAMLPLYSASSGPSAHTLDAGRIRAQLAQSGIPGAVFIDLAAESNRMYAGYLHEAWTAAAGGVAAIVLLLLAATRSARRVLRLAVPLAASVLVVVAALVLAGERLTLLHLVGMLLVVAVVSNYALFFDAGGPDQRAPAPATLASLAIANLTTLAGFGVLALSTVPVLHAIGVVVGPGALLCLVFSALQAGAPREPAHG